MEADSLPTTDRRRYDWDVVNPATLYAVHKSFLMDSPVLIIVMAITQIAFLGHPVLGTHAMTVSQH